MRLNESSVRRAAALSPVWIVPIVALLIAGWLAYEARKDKGATIEINFTNALDMVPGQTQLRLNNVKIGEVTRVKLSKDLKSVNVTAELDREVSSHLSNNSRFWVVTPRISATGVSNLGTLISGVYIVMDPGESGKYQTKFQGLDQPPLFKSDDKGTQFVLSAQELGSVDIASPIYYRQVRVGEVTSYQLGEDNTHVDINIFVRAPYDKIVQTRSRFWNVSGFGVSMGPDGVKAQMASIASLISGGIAFDNTAGFEDAKVAPEGRRFFLYDDRESVQEGNYDIKVYYRLRFNESVRGLNVGAPIEFRGIHIGEVVSITLDASDKINHSTLVYIAMEPQRLDSQEKPSREDVDTRIEELVSQGLRAQMKTASLLTGAKYIDLMFDPDAPESDASLFVRSENFSEIPTMRGAAEDIGLEISKILDRVNSLPIEKMGNDLAESIASLNAIMRQVDRSNPGEKMGALLTTVDTTAQKVNTVLNELNRLMSNVDGVIAPDSEVTYSLTKMLNSVSDAASSIDELMGELSRNPNALISGVEKDEE